MRRRVAAKVHLAVTTGLPRRHRKGTIFAALRIIRPWMRLDKRSWGPGPWQKEPDRLEWRHEGVPCLVVRSFTSGALCGYAAVPPSHPLHGKPYPSIEHLISVHGGLTYSSACGHLICHHPLPGEPGDVWWLGFDTGHSDDYAPAAEAYFRSTFPRFRRMPGEYRTLAYVTAEVERLADQLLEIGRG